MYHINTSLKHSKMRIPNLSIVTEIRTVAFDGGKAGRELKRGMKEIAGTWARSVKIQVGM